MSATKYTKVSLGCYADSAFGHDHVRVRLAEMVEACDEEVATALRGDMSDDAWEEDAALDLLNEHCDAGVSFGFYEGDLMLWTDQRWEGKEE